MSHDRDLGSILASLTVARREATYVYVSAPAGSISGAAATIELHTALDGIGLTAAFARALGDAGIPCNVLAGFHHDHLLVPVDRADDAIAALHSLRGPS